MCQRVTCRTCKKATYRGCGQHVEQVLAGGAGVATVQLCTGAEPGGVCGGAVVPPVLRGGLPRVRSAPPDPGHAALRTRYGATTAVDPARMTLDARHLEVA